MMDLRILGFILCISLAVPGLSQQYLQSAGLRLGHTTGITYQKFVERQQAVELMVSGRHNGLQLNTLYKWYSPAQFDMSDNFVIYYGVGGHFGFERLYPYNLDFQSALPEYDLRRRSFFIMGADAVVGIEYRTVLAPVTLSLEIKPYINYISFREVDGKFWDGALTVKYVFNN